MKTWFDAVCVCVKKWYRICFFVHSNRLVWVVKGDRRGLCVYVSVCFANWRTFDWLTANDIRGFWWIFNRKRNVFLTKMLYKWFELKKKNIKLSVKISIIFGIVMLTKMINTWRWKMQRFWPDTVCIGVLVFFYFRVFKAYDENKRSAIQLIIFFVSFLVCFLSSNFYLNIQIYIYICLNDADLFVVIE